MDSLRTALSQYDSLVVEHEVLLKKYKKVSGRKWKEENEELTRQVAYLERRLSMAEEKIDALRAQLTTTEENSEYYQQELRVTEDDYRRSSDEIMSLETRTNKAELERDTFQEEAEGFKEDAENASREVIALEKRLEAAEDEIDIHLRTIARAESDKVFQDDEIQWLTTKKNEAIAERDAAIADQERLFDDKMAVALELECVKSERDAFQMATDAWDAERASPTEEIRRLKKVNRRLRKSE